MKNHLHAYFRIDRCHSNQGIFIETVPIRVIRLRLILDIGVEVTLNIVKRLGIIHLFKAYFPKC